MSTGPKTSSRAMRWSLVAVKTVGATQAPRWKVAVSGRHSLVHERGALLLGDVEVALDPLLLVVRGDRAEVNGRVERVTDAHVPQAGDELVDDLLLPGLGDEQAGARLADLTRVHEEGEDRAVDRHVEVGVVEDAQLRPALAGQLPVHCWGLTITPAARAGHR